jgi:hypothetical protein
MKIKNITLGSDPEMFLEKDGEIISSVGLIGGTKYKPRKITNLGHAVQEDNVLIEYNIPPCNSLQQWIKEHNFVKDYLDVFVAGIGCKLNFSASAILSDKQLDSDQAKAIGCEPDFDVWSYSVNPPGDASLNLRSAGGHIAIGWDDPTEEVQEELIKAMDITLGLQSVLLDSDVRRKEMYGKAGCFRFTNFGVEYRVLSNFWIVNDELLTWAYYSTLEAIELVNSGKVKDIASQYADQIVEAINTNNRELATKLLSLISLSKVAELV